MNLITLINSISVGHTCNYKIVELSCSNFTWRLDIDQRCESPLYVLHKRHTSLVIINLWVTELMVRGSLTNVLHIK